MASKKSPYTQALLFGGSGSTERGWTELDRIRLRYSVLSRKINTGDFTSAEMEEYNALCVQIKFRENEAREKWQKSFGK